MRRTATAMRCSVGRPELRELPRSPDRRGSSGAKLDRRVASPAWRRNVKWPQRQREPEPARLDVRLLQRPVIEEHDVLLLDRAARAGRRLPAARRTARARRSVSGRPMCSTSMPTSRPTVTAQATRPSVCDRLKRRSGAPAGRDRQLGPAVLVDQERPVARRAPRHSATASCAASARPITKPHRDRRRAGSARRGAAFVVGEQASR